MSKFTCVNFENGIAQIISWCGSIDIGVTECDPETLVIPPCATNLCHGSWIMTCSGIIHNGDRIVETYGANLNDLQEGNTLGVMRTSNVIYNLLAHHLHSSFYIEINDNLIIVE